MNPFPPLTHVALTVRDLAVSVPWYEALFDANRSSTRTPTPTCTTPSTWSATTRSSACTSTAPAPPEAFSEFRVGLDHVAFGCADRAELEKWARRLDELGIDHGGIKDATYGSGLSFRDPDGIALELFAPPG